MMTPPGSCARVWLKPGTLGLCLVLAMVLTVGLAQARTWTVEKDGSGDFTVIQDAVDAAAAGDTVSIGPGRFDDFQYFSYTTGGTGSYTVIGVRQPITVVGTPQETILGPPELIELIDGIGTAGVSSNVEVGHAEFVGLATENVKTGLAIASSTTFATVVVVSCDISLFSDSGVLLFAPNVLIRDCVFHDGLDPQWALFTNNSTRSNGLPSRIRSFVVRASVSNGRLRWESDGAFA